MQVKRCKVCGGTVNILGNGYIRCNYCGQIYDMSGGILGQEQIYNEALDKSQQGTIEGSEQARKLFESISGYKDSNSRALESYTTITMPMIIFFNRCTLLRRSSGAVCWSSLAINISTSLFLFRNLSFHQTRLL